MTRTDARIAGLVGVEAEVNTGPAVAYAGLRRAIEALRDAGATFGEIPGRYGVEWAELFPGEGSGGPVLAEIALAASERRLHRESEQVFRVLAVGAAALCHGVAEVGRPLVLLGVGGADLPSLRGFMRAVEHARTVPGADIVPRDPERVRAPLAEAADLRAERAGCLRRMGLGLEPGDLRADLPASGADDAAGWPDGELYRRAMDPGAPAADRLAAALAYSRAAFFTANWEGMAVVAAAALGLTRGLPDARVPAVLEAAGRHDGQAEAIEFEPAVLRTAADLRAYLCKVLGIQATFRGRQDEALACFRAMRGGEGRVLPEVRAQSHLYAALTLVKRMDRVGEAIRELERGFAAVPPRAGESGGHRRERGWLHNLRGLTCFALGEPREALEHEKRALACIEGLSDASSVHLRINLLSNVSVLQEKTGRHRQALATWARFERAAGASNTPFAKHHAYRAAGLALLAADRDAATAGLERSLACAEESRDDFHACEIRLETGGLLVRAGDAAGAYACFAAGEEAARRLGDPYRIALALAGQAVCGGRAPGAEVAAVAARSLANAGRARALCERADSAVGAAELLPGPRTKLNRPFDLVNFQG